MRRIAFAATAALFASAPASFAQEADDGEAETTETSGVAQGSGFNLRIPGADVASAPSGDFNLGVGAQTSRSQSAGGFNLPLEPQTEGEALPPAPDIGIGPIDTPATDAVEDDIIRLDP